MHDVSRNEVKARCYSGKRIHDTRKDVRSAGGATTARNSTCRSRAGSRGCCSWPPTQLCRRSACITQKRLFSHFEAQFLAHDWQPGLPRREDSTSTAAQQRVQPTRPVPALHLTHIDRLKFGFISANICASPLFPLPQHQDRPLCTTLVWFGLRVRTLVVVPFSFCSFVSPLLFEQLQHSLFQFTMVHTPNPPHSAVRCVCPGPSLTPHLVLFCIAART